MIKLIVAGVIWHSFAVAEDCHYVGQTVVIEAAAHGKVVGYECR